MKYPIQFFISIFMLVLAACSSPSIMKDSVTHIEAAMPELVSEWSMAGVEQDVKVEPIGWMKRLEDPLLMQLVTMANTHNPSLRASSANIERARALAKMAGAALKPQVGLELGTDNAGFVSRSSQGATRVGLGFSWEIDLWGRLKARRNAAEASLSAVEADFRGARNLLAASLAQVYFLGVEIEQQHTIAKNQVDALTEIIRIVKVRSENGMASAQELNLARADLESAKEQLVEIEGAQRNALRAIELLVGRYPSAQTKLADSLPDLPEGYFIGIPSGLLERRPDLVAADRRVAASLDLLKEAKAARLPSFSLSGELGGASSSLSNILSESNLAWKAASSLLAPLFNGGALSAQVDLSSADIELALAGYVETALTAFSEVESALDQTNILAQREDMLRKAYQAAQKALELEKIRYREGESGMLDLLIIQQKSFALKSSHLTVVRKQLDQYISLHLALGGDW